MRNKISIEEYMNSSVATEKEKKEYKEFMDNIYKKLEEEKVYPVYKIHDPHICSKLLNRYEGIELARAINNALDNYFDFSKFRESENEKYFAVIKNTDLFGKYSKNHLYFSKLFGYIALLDWETNTKINISNVLNCDFTNIIEVMKMHIESISDKPFKEQSPIDKKIKKLLSMKEFILESGSQEVKDKFQKMYDALLLEKEQSNGIK